MCVCVVVSSLACTTFNFLTSKFTLENFSEETFLKIPNNSKINVSAEREQNIHITHLKKEKKEGDKVNEIF